MVGILNDFAGCSDLNLAGYSHYLGDLECSSVVEHMFHMFVFLGSIPGAEKMSKDCY